MAFPNAAYKWNRWRHVSKSFIIEEADAYERQTREKRETYERQMNDELTGERAAEESRPAKLKDQSAY